VLILT